MNDSAYAPDQDIQSSSNQSISNQSNKHRVNQVNLQRAWDVSQRATREEWDEWMRRFALQLLKEAPAPALRACAELAYAYQPLARELFSAAFASCWTELSEQYRISLVNALKTAFFADASPEILQTLLNLAEYAERDGVQGGLPIEIDVLAELALKCRAYAKALHYKELEHELSGGLECIEDLISINKKLDLPGKFCIVKLILQYLFRTFIPKYCLCKIICSPIFRGGTGCPQSGSTRDGTTRDTILVNN